MLHPFEKSGLGSYPYTYKGCEKSPRGSSCCYCGTAIVYKFHFQSADGKLFHVGSDCIRKAGGDHLTKIIEPDLKKMERENRIARKAAKLEKQKNQIAELLVVKTDKLKALPHPTEYFAKIGKTMFDYLNFFIHNRKYDRAIAILKTEF